MTAGRRFGAAAALVVLAAAGLAGCASEPTRIQPGTTAAETLQRLGAPTGRYPLNGGGERLQYSRMPAGFEVTDIDVDAAGKVVSVTQVLNEARFGHDIKVDQWRQNDVTAFYGRPYEISRVSSFDGVVWTWRYKAVNERRMLYIYMDPTGVVRRYHTGDDLELDRFRE
jgi:phosphoribosylcarboxyaminoimidazole (NCAIR) mutase